MKQTKWILYVLMACILSASTGFSAITIDNVRVENLEKEVLEGSFVQAYTALRAGQELEDEAALNMAIAQDVASLRRSGRVSYVRASLEQDDGQLTLVYSVTPRRRLQRIDVTSGSLRVKKIKKELDLSPGDYIDEALAGEKARAVEAYCRKNKYPEATVEWELIDDEQTGGVDLKLTVSEGDKMRVKRIRFEGERFLSDSRSGKTRRLFKKITPATNPLETAVEQFATSDLRKIMNQKTTWWITPWFGTYHPERAEADREVIKRFYLDHGFLDVQVDEPEIRDLGNGNLELLYRIREGELYRLGSIGLEGVTLFEQAELEKQIHLQTNQIASQAAMNAAAATLNRYYGNRGYIQNNVQPVVQTDPSTRQAHLRLAVHEGHLATINEIIIRGNEKTKDEVLRRELAVYPGEMFNQQRVETSENRLRNLNYFETVNSSYVSAAETNAYDLTFDVKEKTMGSFLVGAGFSSVDSLVGFAEVSHGNFDIRNWPPIGDGQKVKLRVQAGSERKDIEVSFVEPWFLDRKLAFGFDFYNRENDYNSDEYTQETLGGRLSLSKPFSPFTRGTLSYTLEDITIADVSSTASTAIKAEEGSRIKSTLGLRATRDTRDQVFVPTRGNRTTGAAELSGSALLGDTETVFFELKSSHFWPVWKDHTLNLRGSIQTVHSYGSDDVALFDRLFLGGPRTLRGFEYRDVGPRAADDPDEPIGGETSYFASLEYTIPLWEKIRAAAFYDIGTVNESSFSLGTDHLNSDYGIGIRFDLPMFPLRLDYAIPHITDDENDDADPRWNFLLGYSF